jgi:hypothetical protein
MREVVAKFLEVVLAQHFLVPPFGMPRHAREFYKIRLLFATLRTARLNRILVGHEKGTSNS